jgi:Queuosine biosynthesis protein/NADP oxidoreductase coenzyme F420-dependent
MKIAIIGSGIVGQTLGKKLVELGHNVVLGTRDPNKLDEAKGWAGSLSDWLTAVGNKATVATFTTAAAQGEIIINATHGMASLAALQIAGTENLQGKILIDVANELAIENYLCPHLFPSTSPQNYQQKNHQSGEVLPAEEEYLISEETAEKINQTHRSGGRIIAVGTTVVRALESAVDEMGQVEAQHNYTRLRITKDRQLRAVEGLLTGMHEPEASHLDLLTAFLPAEDIRSAYVDAVKREYLWHEFGDLNLLI